MARRLWNPLAQTWFPNGLDDPFLGLIQVTIEKAEYWDAPTNAMTVLQGLASSLVSGDDLHIGEHQAMDLSPGG